MNANDNFVHLLPLTSALRKCERHIGLNRITCYKSRDFKAGIDLKTIGCPCAPYSRQRNKRGRDGSTLGSASGGSDGIGSDSFSLSNSNCCQCGVVNHLFHKLQALRAGHAACRP